MWIDILFLLLMGMAVFRGTRQGFLVAVFSAVAFIIGLAAAIKCSAAVAVHLRTGLHLSARWLPVLAFIIVFLGIVILVRIGGKLVEKTLDLAMMGWLNKLAGVLLYCLLYTIIFSVLLFYAGHLHLLSANSLSASVTYPVIRPWGPRVIDEFGKWVPFFKDMFAQLEIFFGRLNNDLDPRGTI
jgi:membrane protein required for colicin V production